MILFYHPGFTLCTDVQVTPVIDVITDRTMVYEANVVNIPNVGTFDWLDTFFNILLVFKT